MVNDNEPDAVSGQRLMSLDVYRGLVMFLLIGEGAGVYHAVRHLMQERGGYTDPVPVVYQFFHHPCFPTPTQ